MARRRSIATTLFPQQIFLCRLARGKFHLLGGHAGDGKSTLLAQFAAIGSVAGAASLATPLLGGPAAAAKASRPIPSSGEQLTLIGLGSWITFNVGDDWQLQDECAAVIAAFLAGGGRLIDSSPMYGSSQPTVGYGLRKQRSLEVFSADKVWTADTDGGGAQIERSREAWRRRTSPTDDTRVR